MARNFLRHLPIGEYILYRHRYSFCWHRCSDRIKLIYEMIGLTFFRVMQTRKQIRRCLRLILLTIFDIYNSVNVVLLQKLRKEIEHPMAEFGKNFENECTDASNPSEDRLVQKTKPTISEAEKSYSQPAFAIANQDGDGTQKHTRKRKRKKKFTTPSLDNDTEHGNEDNSRTEKATVSTSEIAKSIMESMEKADTYQKALINLQYDQRKLAATIDESKNALTGAGQRMASSRALINTALQSKRLRRKQTHALDKASELMGKIPCPSREQRCLDQNDVQAMVQFAAYDQATEKQLEEKCSCYRRLKKIIQNGIGETAKMRDQLSLTQPYYELDPNNPLTRVDMPQIMITSELASFVEFFSLIKSHSVSSSAPPDWKLPIPHTLQADPNVTNSLNPLARANSTIDLLARSMFSRLGARTTSESPAWNPDLASISNSSYLLYMLFKGQDICQAAKSTLPLTKIVSEKALLDTSVWSASSRPTPESFSSLETVRPIAEESTKCSPTSVKIRVSSKASSSNDKPSKATSSKHPTVITYPGKKAIVRRKDFEESENIARELFKEASPERSRLPEGQTPLIDLELSTSTTQLYKYPVLDSVCEFHPVKTCKRPVEQLEFITGYIIRLMKRHTHSLAKINTLDEDDCEVCRESLCNSPAGLPVYCIVCQKKVHLNCTYVFYDFCVPVPKLSKDELKRNRSAVQDYVHPDFKPKIPALIVHITFLIMFGGYRAKNLYQNPETDVKFDAFKKLMQTGGWHPNLLILEPVLLGELLKYFVGSLKPRLITEDFFKKLKICVKGSSLGGPVNFERLSNTFVELPDATRETLIFLLMHLQEVITMKEVEMPAAALARAFTPILIEGFTREQSFRYYGVIEQLLKFPRIVWQFLFCQFVEALGK